MMTKTIKIGDLTLNQIRKITSRCSNYKSCYECEKKDNQCFKVCKVHIMIIESDLLDQEVEINE